MKLHYLILCLPILLLSCGNPSEKENSVKADLFREDVLKIRNSGLLKNVSDTKLDSLIKIFQTDSVNGLKNLLVASGDLLKIHVKLNGRTLQDVYQKICDTIGMKFPELKCDEVQSFTLPNQENGKDTGWVMVRLRFGQNWYERKMYYFRDWEIDDFIYRIYNRMLADAGKQERLHLVEYTCLECAKTQDDFMGTTDVTKYGFLLLNKTQEDSLLLIHNLEMEQENEFLVFTSKQMDEQLSKFESTGLIEEIGTAWYDRVKTDIHQSSIYSMEDFYDFFDTLFSKTNFDTLNDYNPYQEVLGSLAKISRGKFNPTEILDEISTTSTHNVQFNFQGDVYKFEAEARGKYLFPGIIDNVNKALEDHKTGGAFYTILTRDNVCMLVYLDDKKAEKAKASGFFSEFTKGPSQELKDRWSATVPF